MGSDRPVIIRARPGMRCLNCLVRLEEQFDPAACKGVLSAYFCAECSGSLELDDKTYLMGWGAVPTLFPPANSPGYQLGLKDRKRFTHSEDVVNVELMEE